MFKIKMHQMPGDIPKSDKILLMEGKYHLDKSAIARLANFNGGNIEKAI